MLKNKILLPLIFALTLHSAPLRAENWFTTWIVNPIKQHGTKIAAAVGITAVAAAIGYWWFRKPDNTKRQETKHKRRGRLKKLKTQLPVSPAPKSDAQAEMIDGALQELELKIEAEYNTFAQSIGDINSSITMLDSMNLSAEQRANLTHLNEIFRQKRDAYLQCQEEARQRLRNASRTPTLDFLNSIPSGNNQSNEKKECEEKQHIAREESMLEYLNARLSGPLTIKVRDASLQMVQNHNNADHTPQPDRKEQEEKKHESLQNNIQQQNDATTSNNNPYTPAPVIKIFNFYKKRRLGGKKRWIKRQENYEVSTVDGKKVYKKIA
jgi:hypothetical protein